MHRPSLRPAAESVTRTTARSAVVHAPLLHGTPARTPRSPSPSFHSHAAGQASTRGLNSSPDAGGAGGDSRWHRLAAPQAPAAAEHTHPLQPA
eukprot:CAMPEP_0179978874 /NCGR_PEP_ID=MMETSP0983-20121128/40962_1 /TAXON_ID=483367 /ORGANISM="non described non described, Strain CCMP 2436" /LENGTH=92 /DNA_ID=CAMNT_0021896431 /DNA_START=1 /DNA_END=277 /DNA_ORIENTATION=+